jgi:zinc transporter ZupT
MLTGLLAFSVVATLAGGYLPIAKVISRQGLWRLFAFRSGLLISITFTDLLPEAWLYQPTWAGWGALGGFLLFYAAESLAMTDACPEYLENCKTHVLGWAALAGLVIHALMDGVNLSVAFSAGSAAGLAAGIALCLHKLADGLTLTSLFRGAGYSRRRTLTALAVVAAATPAGAVMVRTGAAAAGSYASAGLLGLAGGSFLYIGAREILPRLHRDGDAVTLLFFGAGVLAMLALHGVAG